MAPRFLAAALTAVCLLAAAPLRAERVDIIHVNDVYQIEAMPGAEPRGGLARLAAFVAGVRRDQPATLFTFGGDTLSPAVASSVFQGAQMVAAWNLMGLDAAVPGNHEFDFGPAVFAERVKESRFPWLAANVRETATRQPLVGLAPSLLKTVGGVKVGVVGLLTDETPTLSRPGPTVAFASPLTDGPAAAEALRRQGAQVVVALTHQPLAADKALAATGAFDLILGGHEHVPLTVLVGRTPILKAGADAREALRVTLETGVDGRLATMSWERVPLDSRFAAAPEVTAEEKRYGVELKARLGLPVGETAVALDATTANRQKETNLGDFVADAWRAATGADAALVNSGALRGLVAVPPGPVTRLDLQRLLPFNNRLVTLKVSGGVLQAALEHSVACLVERPGSGCFAQVSGMRLTYDPRRPPGTRVVRVEVGGKPLDPQRAYTLTVNAYLAGGGDGYAMLKNQSPAVDPEAGPLESEAVARAFTPGTPIAPEVDGRIAAVAPEAPAERR